MATDNELKGLIAEWKPLFVYLIIPIYIFLTLSVVLVIKYRKKIAIEKFLLYFFTFISVNFQRQAHSYMGTNCLSPNARWPCLFL